MKYLLLIIVVTLAYVMFATGAVLYGVWISSFEDLRDITHDYTGTVANAWRRALGIKKRHSSF